MLNKATLLAVFLVASITDIYCQDSAKSNKFSFTPAGEIPPAARPAPGSGSSKITVINKTKDYVGLGFINAEGNLSTGYSDGSKGHTDFFIGPGSRTHRDWPFIVSNGSCFVLYSLKGRILGYGTAKETGEYEIILK